MKRMIVSGYQFMPATVAAGGKTQAWTDFEKKGFSSVLSMMSDDAVSAIAKYKKIFALAVFQFYPGSYNEGVIAVNELEAFERLTDMADLHSVPVLACADVPSFRFRTRLPSNVTFLAEQYSPLSELTDAVQGTTNLAEDCSNGYIRAVNASPQLFDYVKQCVRQVMGPKYMGLSDAKKLDAGDCEVRLYRDVMFSSVKNEGIDFFPKKTMIKDRGGLAKLALELYRWRANSEAKEKRTQFSLKTI